MTITVTIRTGNEAFQDGRLGAEVGRLLRQAAQRIEHEGLEVGYRMVLLDANGNTCGAVTVKP